MAADFDRAFRDYATRVSFSISLSRNQLAVLRQITLDIEGYEGKPYAFGQGVGYVEATNQRETARSMGMHVSDMFIPGTRFLIANGFLTHTDPTTMTPKWSRYPYELTLAGEHLVAMLRIAHLVPQRAVNQNKKRKRRAA